MTDWQQETCADSRASPRAKGDLCQYQPSPYSRISARRICSARSCVSASCG